MKKTKVKVIEYRGITLMSLVITVIVLLILAGISIGMISGENGILNKARKSKNSIDEATALEYIKISIAASRTSENDVSEQTLKKELDKFFDDPEIISISKNDYMVKINDKVYNYSNGEVTSGYELKTSINGIVESSKEPKIVSSKIYGNSIQNGEPSPDTPVEVQSVGDLVTEGEYTGKYKIPIIVRGKNLYPNYTASYSAQQCGVTQSCTLNKNSITLNGTSISTGGRNLLNYYNKGFNIEKDKTYTLSCVLLKGNAEPDTFTVLIADKATSEFKGKSCKLGTPTTFTATEPFTAICGINVTKEDVTFDDVEVGIMIEETDKVTDYEPYVNPNTTNIYLNEPLRKVGDYADYIDFETGKVVRNIGSHNFDGSESWVLTGDTSTNYQGFAVASKNYNVKIGTFACMSDRFPYSSTNKANICQIKNGSYGMRIIASSDIVPNLTTSEFEQWLSNNNTMILYPLETPTEETIELPTIPTHKGTNIITVDTDIKPSKMEMVYYKLNQ